MDPGYYDRKAADALKKVANEMKKRGELEKQAAALDASAAKEEAAAWKATSPSTQSSRLRGAENSRSRAADMRQKAGAASIAAGNAQAAATKAQEDAAGERERRRKAAETKANRAAADAKRRADSERRTAEAARREADRQQRQRATADRQMASQLDSLGSRTADLRARTTTLEAAITASRRAAPSTITVLLIAGTTEGGTTPLRLDREVREIDVKVRSSPHRDQINLTWIQATRVSDILDALNRVEPDVVHFSGHGGADSLLFEAPDGTPHALRGDQLGLLLQAAPRRIRLMVFNACESAAQARAAVEWTEFSIGMERSIGDDAAKEWAGQFYGSLGAGVTVDVAFRQATAHATVLTSADAAGSPQLFVNSFSDAAATVLVSPPLFDAA